MEDKYSDWYKLSLQVKELKAKEIKIRRELCAELFGGRVGEFTVKRDNPIYVLSAKSDVNRNIDETALLIMMDDLTDQERRCIKFSPKLVLGEYRKLDDDSKLHEVISESPAMPTLKIDIKPS